MWLPHALALLRARQVPLVVVESDAERVAMRILDLMREPIFVGGQECFVTASVGIAMYPRDGASVADAFGIDYIEAGHPAVSPEIARAVREVASLGLNAEIVAHSRALRSDIDQALKADADWVGIFFSVADKRLEEQFRKDIDQATALIQDCVSYAKAHGLKVRYTPEDTVRSDPAKVARIAVAASEAGADRIGIADTTGCMTPFAMHAFVRRLREAVPARTALGVHCHNDLGMAVANSFAAVEAGAEVVVAGQVAQPVQAHLAREEIDRVFSLDTSLRNVDAIFARVFGG